MTKLSWLGLLTKKFINLLKHAEDGVLDLNKAAETLEVNVLAEYLHLCIWEWLIPIFVIIRCKRGGFMT